MMWGLAKQAWAVAGWDLPTYRRSETPGQMFRGSSKDLVDADVLERDPRSR